MVIKVNDLILSLLYLRVSWIKFKLFPDIWILFSCVTDDCASNSVEFSRNFIFTEQFILGFG